VFDTAYQSLGDQWYPSGYVEITGDMFKPNINFLTDEIVVNI